MTAVTWESIGAVSSADVNPFEVVYELLIEFPTTSFTKVVTLILWEVSSDKLLEGVTEKVLLELDAIGVEDICIQLLKLSEDNWIVPVQVVLDEFVVIKEVSIDSEKVTEIVVPIETDDAESDGEVELTVGVVVSTTNEFIVKELLAFPAESVTVIVQFE